jgi:hypothetical protein
LRGVISVELDELCSASDTCTLDICEAKKKVRDHALSVAEGIWQKHPAELQGARVDDDS